MEHPNEDIKPEEVAELLVGIADVQELFNVLIDNNVYGYDSMFYMCHVLWFVESTVVPIMDDMQKSHILCLCNQATREIYEITSNDSLASVLTKESNWYRAMRKKNIDLINNNNDYLEASNLIYRQLFEYHVLIYRNWKHRNELIYEV